MDRNLLDYIPHVLRTIREFNAITNAEQLEFVDLWNFFENVLRDQFIEDATENGVSRWEQILKITPLGSESLYSRKFRIVSKLNDSLPYTMIRLKNMLEVLCGNDGYSIELQSDNYLLIVRVALKSRDNYNDVADLLKKIIPANIIIDLSLMFNKHVYFLKYTHQELANHTQYELRNEPLTYYTQYDDLMKYKHIQLLSYTNHEIRNGGL